MTVDEAGLELDEAWAAAQGTDTPIFVHVGTHEGMERKAVVEALVIGRENGWPNLRVRRVAWRWPGTPAGDYPLAQAGMIIRAYPFATYPTLGDALKAIQAQRARGRWEAEQYVVELDEKIAAMVKVRDNARALLGTYEDLAWSEGLVWEKGKPE